MLAFYSKMGAFTLFPTIVRAVTKFLRNTKTTQKQWYDENFSTDD